MKIYFNLMIEHCVPKDLILKDNAPRISHVNISSVIIAKFLNDFEQTNEIIFSLLFKLSLLQRHI